MNDDHHDEDPLRRLFQLARGHRPFGDPHPIGFDTRLRAALAGAEPSAVEWLTRLSLRFSAASLPTLLALAAFLAYHHAGLPPEGVGEFVAHWAGFLPLPF